MAYERLRDAGTRVLSTDTIPHASNAIAIAPVLATALATQFERDTTEPEGASAWFDGPGSS
jgi:hypothetical protein